MASELERSLRGLRQAVSELGLPLRLPQVEICEQQARAAVQQLDDYVLPRLATLDAPVLCVVGGSTGAGKSTLVNSLVGRPVSRPGVIRPTTRAPVLVHHPQDAHWFADDRILPGMARTRGAVPGDGSRTLHLIAEPTLPPGLALLDAPDVDSVDAENRAVAAQLLAAADLWLFVTSAARYADAVPWEYLLAAAQRSAAVAVVLDRVAAHDMAELGTHLGQMMSERALGESTLFAVPETGTDEAGLLPASAVQPIKSWLAGLAHDATSRAALVQQTLEGAVAQLIERAPDLVTAAEAQTETLDALRAEADHHYAEAVRTIGVQTADGSLLRGEVLTRWHEFVGTGEFFRALEQKISWLRDRIAQIVRGEPPGAGQVKVAVEAGLEALIREEVEAAAERTAGAWQAHPAGRAVLAGSAAMLSRSSPDFPGAVARAIRDWQGDVLDLVADEGMPKRSRARFLALGVNAVGVALMIVVFSQTGGLVGAEVGVAGGTAILAQRVLEAVFGDQAIRRLAERAKDDLDSRVERLLADELRRYHRALEDLAVDPGQADRIAASITEVARAAGRTVQLRPRASGRERPSPELSTTARADSGSPPPALGPGSSRAEAIPGLEVVEAEVVEAEVVEAGRAEARPIPVDGDAQQQPPGRVPPSATELRGH